jgi:hypothetical protein
LVLKSLRQDFASSSLPLPFFGLIDK